MNDSVSLENSFGEMIHAKDQLNPLTLAFGSCCSSCSCSAAVHVAQESAIQ